LAQLLDQHLDGGAGAAVLGRPAPLLEPAHDHDPATLLSEWAACSAWSRHTITVKNDGGGHDAAVVAGGRRAWI
jgi:hypothetical protein